TKGPVAVVLTAVPLFLVQAIDTRMARPRLVPWAVFALISVSVTVPWFAMAMARQEDFGEDFFWRHNIVRFVDPFDHEGPPWYYLPGLLVGLLPAALLLPGFICFLLGRNARTVRRRPAALGFLLAASAWGVLFFSAAGCKRPAYILPALPPLALSLGSYLTTIVPDGRVLRAMRPMAQRFAEIPIRAALFVLAAAAGLCLLAVGKDLTKPSVGLALAGACLVLAALVSLRSLRWRPDHAWWACTAAVFLVLFVGIYQF